MPTENKNPELHNLNDFNDTLINIKDNTKGRSSRNEKSQEIPF